MHVVVRHDPSHSLKKSVTNCEEIRLLSSRSMVRIHQGALPVTPMVLGKLLGTIFFENQRLCADLCAELTQAHLRRGVGLRFPRTDRKERYVR